MLAAVAGLVAVVLVVGACNGDPGANTEPRTRDVYVEDLIGQSWYEAEKMTGADAAPPYSVLRTVNVLELSGAPIVDPVPPMYDQFAYVVVAACFYGYDNRIVLGITPRAAATPDVIDRAKQLQFQSSLTPGYDCQDTAIPIKVPISR
ncbi:hypothetical protein IU501_13890 [Nocardia otitidiscaviarum]|uniref:hypothetical protein n=1 Tax=Nocardia otitidiscaviarum TaxID=1823 RepID=UPI0011DD1D6D|nr:hypothetical protein [Nocardia otitidiscaviarum]MBF6134082.1 hypothetical protein [Nocardia otitidiscaviarum]MBF6484257.1 hypothetical protein [Nocardia otitidiscaviarum]